MLGFHVFVYRQSANVPSRKTEKILLARWETSMYGLKWIDELVKNNLATVLSGNGYPTSYSIAANVLLPIITTSLPPNSSPPVFGDDYFIPEGWSGQVELDREKISQCADDEQLLVEAWDQS